MFQFPGLPPPGLCIRPGVAGHDPRRVPPFGHPGIAGRLRLPPDYRGLPRPSSASCAKASAARPYYLRFPLVSVSQKMISDGYAHRSIALRSQMRLSWLFGGDPAARSRTATLLRLHPPHPPHLRRLRPLGVRPAASGADDSGGVTGGVYKARERIHRGVLIRDY